MKALKVTHKTSTDCVDNSYVFLDIDVLHNDKKLTLVIEGEIWAKYKVFDGDQVTPAYSELQKVYAVCMRLTIYDDDANEVPEFIAGLDSESKEIEELLKFHCYEY